MVPPRGTARLCAFYARRCNVNVLGGVGLITSLGTYVRDGVGWGGAKNVLWHLHTYMMLCC